MENFFTGLGAVAGAAMPLFNIPLMARIIRRRSCEDISLAWLFGVWICILLMVPAALVSDDLVLKAFAASNVVLFSCVVGIVVYFRWKPSPGSGN